MNDTPFMAQRRKLHELRDKQDAGQATATEEAEVHHPAFKKKKKKKASG